MNEYRITKYNPKNRVNGIYTVNEWTSISDIGKTFDAGVLSYEKYKNMEQAYINCCIEIMRQAGISVLSVCNAWYYDENIHFPKLVSCENTIREIILCCLREKCWVKLKAKRFFIHFGYDYYMYVGTNLPYPLVADISQRYALFCEEFPSPYR